MPAPAAAPIAADTQIVAAVMMPYFVLSLSKVPSGIRLLEITPAPRKPTPAVMVEAILLASTEAFSIPGIAAAVPTLAVSLATVKAKP